jgi:hypothetical protein
MAAGGELSEEQIQEARHSSQESVAKLTEELEGHSQLR